MRLLWKKTYSAYWQIQKVSKLLKYEFCVNSFFSIFPFYIAFATSVACQQGMLTLLNTWFRPPFWDLLILQMLRPDFPNLPCLSSTFHLEYTSILLCPMKSCVFFDDVCQSVRGQCSILLIVEVYRNSPCNASVLSSAVFSYWSMNMPDCGR